MTVWRLWRLIISSKIDNRNLLSRRYCHYLGWASDSHVETRDSLIVDCHRRRKGGPSWRRGCRHLGKTKSVVRGKGSKAGFEAEEIRNACIPFVNIGRELRIKHVAVVIVVVMDSVGSKSWIRRWCRDWIEDRIGTVITIVNSRGVRVGGRIGNRPAIEIGIIIRVWFGQGIWRDARGIIACKSSVHCLVKIAVSHLTFLLLNRLLNWWRVSAPHPEPLHKSISHWSRRQSHEIYDRSKVSRTFAYGVDNKVSRGQNTDTGVGNLLPVPGAEHEQLLARLDGPDLACVALSHPQAHAALEPEVERGRLQEHAHR